MFRTPIALPTISDAMQPGFFGMTAVAASAALTIRHIWRGWVTTLCLRTSQPVGARAYGLADSVIAPALMSRKTVPATPRCSPAELGHLFALIAMNSPPSAAQVFSRRAFRSFE